ncbi:MAG TPA: DNA gyrase inhibitor YacG [Bdellovibrionales bacterium]|nr:DNA gyrase inhibitor YacG [Bdellovibrionales bacterium]
MIVKCPTCRKDTNYEANPHRPFCSERCRLLDLGAWAQEKYAVPAEEQTPQKTTGESERGPEDED